VWVTEVARNWLEQTIAQGWLSVKENWLETESWLKFTWVYYYLYSGRLLNSGQKGPSLYTFPTFPPLIPMQSATEAISTDYSQKRTLPEPSTLSKRIPWAGGRFQTEFVISWLYLFPNSKCSRIFSMLPETATVLSVLLYRSPCLHCALSNLMKCHLSSAPIPFLICI